MGPQPWCTASGRSRWWQGSLVWIWHSRTGNAVDHGLGGGETRSDLVVAGLT
jgi:hypothetical protein